MVESTEYIFYTKICSLWLKALINDNIRIANGQRLSTTLFQPQALGSYCKRLRIEKLHLVCVILHLAKTVLNSERTRKPCVYDSDCGARICKRWRPRIDSASLCGLAGRYDK
jgi:hypothetical protein